MTLEGKPVEMHHYYYHFAAEELSDGIIVKNNK